MPRAMPAKILALHGRGDGKDSAGRPIPKPPRFTREAPEPPSWLSREAKAEWNRVVPGLERLDLLKPEDRGTLATYCELWATFADAQRTMAVEGLVVTNRSVRKDGTETTWQTKNPAVAVALAAATQLRQYAALFGLSPADERNLGATTPDDDADDPFAG